MSRKRKKRQAKKQQQKSFNGKKLRNRVIYIAVLLVVQELIFRWLFPMPELSNFNRTEFQAFSTHQITSANYMRKLDMLWRSTPDTNHTFVFDMNFYGFRDRAWSTEKSSGKRVLFVGDSFVEGMMAEEEDNIPSVFRNEAESAGMDIETMNMGMMGVGIPHYKNVMYNTLPLFQPDEVILVLYANDIPSSGADEPVRVIIPQYYSPWKPRLLQLFSLVGADEPLPFRWNLREEGFYKPVPDPGNPWTTQEADLSQKVASNIAEAMKRADFNYFRTNWVLQEQNSLKAPFEMAPYLKYFKDICAQNGARLSVVYVPSRHQVSTYYYQFERQCCLACPEMIDMTGREYQVHQANLVLRCQEQGIPFLDLTPAILEQENAGNHLYWNYDDHAKAKGYQLMARNIYRWWANSGS